MKPNLRRFIYLTCVLVLVFSAPSVCAHGFQDQVNDPVTYSLFDCDSSPPSPARIYQSFTPTRPVLSSIEIRVFVPTPPGSGVIRVQIQADRPNGRVLGEGVQPFPTEGSPGLFSTALVHFDFVPPLHVKTGREYFIAWMSSRVSFWVGSKGDVYPDGRAYKCTGDPWHEEIDLNFRTFAEPASQRAQEHARRDTHPNFPSFQTSGDEIRQRTWGSIKVKYR
jgi:hypothetical protein